ncbi:MAG: isochorismate synthase, partial [Myxococcota bacterium]
AISLAREHGQSTLLRAISEVGIPDPIAWLTPRLNSDRGVLWSDGRTGMELAALGVRRLWRATERPSLSAQEFLAQERQLLVQGWLGSGQPSLTELPLALGGFSFQDGAAAPEDPWSGWPTHELMIPELLLVRWAGTPTMAVVTAVVNPEDEVDLVAQNLVDARRMLLEPVLATESQTDSVAPQHVAERGEGQEHWCARIEAAKRAFGTSALDKVVLARRSHFVAPLGSCFDPAVTLERLRRSHPDAFVFAITHGEGKWFLGATPELLARVSSGRFDGHALAGTIASSENEDEADQLAEELRTSVKNQYEHDVVIRDIERALSVHCERVEVAKEPTVRRLTELQHLETAVRGRVREREALLEIVGDLHPTPAVGGHPRAEAARYLAEHEALHRGWYASPIGWIGARGEGAFAVALRCAILTEHEAVAFVGAGIVADSVPEDEWQETELKLRTVASALALRRTGS